MDFSKLRQLSEKSTPTNPSKELKGDIHTKVDNSVDKSVENLVQKSANTTSSIEQDSNSDSTIQNSSSVVKNDHDIITNKQEPDSITTDADSVYDELRESFDNENTTDDDLTNDSIVTNEESDEVFLGDTKDAIPSIPIMPKEVSYQLQRRDTFKKEKAQERRTKNDPKKKAQKTAKKYSHRTRVNQSIEKPAPIIEEYASTTPKKKHPGSLAKASPIPRDKWNNEDSSKRKYRYHRDEGRINQQEKEFYLNLGITARDVETGKFDLDFLNPPQGFGETDEERRERIEKISQTAQGLDYFKRGNSKKFSRKHFEMIDFLARFKYAKPTHMSYMFGERPNTTYKRLLDMREYGLVIDYPILNTEPLWFLTKTGMALSGYDYHHITNSTLSEMNMPHTFLINHLAGNLWGNNLNVLDQKDFPAKNRYNAQGEKVFGENLISELAIQSSLSKIRRSEKSDVFVPIIRNMMEREFDRWEKKGGVEFGLSPEFSYGNEFMFALTPAKVIGTAYHVPDMVVARERNKDGKPQSIAIEAERSQSKTPETYRRVLQAYNLDKQMFKQVIWVVHKKQTANRLIKAEEGLGMLKSGKMRILPITTEDGIYTDPRLWQL